MRLVRAVAVQDENAGTIGAGDLPVWNTQVNLGMTERPHTAVAGDGAGFYMNDLGMIDRIRLYAHGGLSPL